MRAFRLVGVVSAAALVLGACGVFGAGGDFSGSLGGSLEPSPRAFYPTEAALHARQASSATPSISRRKDSATPPASSTLTATRAPTSSLESPPTTETRRTDEPTGSWLCSPLEFVELQDLPRVVSERYNPPVKPGSDARHQGVDFAYFHWNGQRLLEGTAVRAALGGRVAAAVSDSFPFGNLAMVETRLEELPAAVANAFRVGRGESLYLFYAHMGPGSPAVALEEAVLPCDTLGYVGKTGNTEAAHLHLEARVGPQGRRFEQFSNFRGDEPPQARDNYRLWRTSGTFRHFDPLRLLLFEQWGGAFITLTPSRP